MQRARLQQDATAHQHLPPLQRYKLAMGRKYTFTLPSSQAATALRMAFLLKSTCAAQSQITAASAQQLSPLGLRSQHQGDATTIANLRRLDFCS